MIAGQSNRRRYIIDLEVEKLREKDWSDGKLFDLVVNSELEYAGLEFDRMLKEKELKREQHLSYILDGLQRSEFVHENDCQYNLTKSLEENIDFCRNTFDLILTMTEQYLNRYKEYNEFFNKSKI